MGSPGSKHASLEDRAWDPPRDSAEVPSEPNGSTKGMFIQITVERHLLQEQVLEILQESCASPHTRPVGCLGPTVYES